MKYLISYDLHGVLSDVSNDVRNDLEECGYIQILGSTFFYEISGVESVKSVYNQIYEIIHKRLQNSKGASFDLVVGNCSDLYCSCFDRFHQH
jgi:hypothetical protein